MAWLPRMSPARRRIRRWASRLPDGLVISIVLLLGLILVCLLMAAITLALLQLLNLAGVDETRILIVQWIILVLGVVLALPMMVLCAYLFDLLMEVVGTLCPNCRQRELEWRSGSWMYGQPPCYQYYVCTKCGTQFRQLCGGQGTLGELEQFDHDLAPSPTQPNV